jgi:hypothetical protein
MKEMKYKLKIIDIPKELMGNFQTKQREETYKLYFLTREEKMLDLIQ